MFNVFAVEPTPFFFPYGIPFLTVFIHPCNILKFGRNRLGLSCKKTIDFSYALGFVSDSLGVISYSS